MALVKMKDLLRRAEEKNIGCGAFSVGNMEMVRGAILLGRLTSLWSLALHRLCWMLLRFLLRKTSPE